MYIIELDGEPYKTVTVYYKYKDLEKAKQDAISWVTKYKRIARIYTQIESIFIAETVVEEIEGVYVGDSDHEHDDRIL